MPTGISYHCLKLSTAGNHYRQPTGARKFIPIDLSWASGYPTEKHSSSMNKRHCWYATDSPGWGCKFLNRIFRDPQGPGNYKTSNKYWYNFGNFDENGRWIINKNYLLERIALEIEEKGIDTCPYFDFENVRKSVQNLPELVEIDNLNFKKYYITEYKNGEKIQKAVNIRHIKIDTRPPDLRRIIAEHEELVGRIAIN